MNKLLKATIALGAMMILAACGDSLKSLSPEDQLFTMKVSEQFQDVMDKKDAIVAVRLEGAPAENITLLQAKEGDIEKDILYAVTIDLPEGVVITLSEFEEVMNEQMNAINEIVDFKVMPVKESDTQINYIAETRLNNVPYYEYCRIAVEEQITTICLGTTNDTKGAEAAINSIQFKK